MKITVDPANAIFAIEIPISERMPLQAGEIADLIGTITSSMMPGPDAPSDNEPGDPEEDFRDDCTGDMSCECTACYQTRSQIESLKEQYLQALSETDPEVIDAIINQRVFVQNGSVIIRLPAERPAPTYPPFIGNDFGQLFPWMLDRADKGVS